MSRRRVKELVPITAPPSNAMAAELAAIVGSLPTGIYRSQMTICRIELDANGLEKSATVISAHVFDFESRAVTEPAPRKVDEP